MFIRLYDSEGQILDDMTVGNVHEAEFQKVKCGAYEWKEYHIYTQVNEETGFIEQRMIKINADLPTPANYIDYYAHGNPVGRWSFTLLRWIDTCDLKRYQVIDADNLWVKEIQICDAEKTEFDILTNEPSFKPARWNAETEVWEEVV